MNNASDFAFASTILASAVSLTSSALPDAPVVPDAPRASLTTRARLIIVAASRFVSRPAPDVAKDPAMAQG